jgi:hypothetical protein
MLVPVRCDRAALPPGPLGEVTHVGTKAAPGMTRCHGRAVADAALSLPINVDLYQWSRSAR